MLRPRVWCRVADTIEAQEGGAKPRSQQTPQGRCTPHGLEVSTWQGPG